MELKQRSLIVSAGRSCFVRCEGCYNYFGETAQLSLTENIVAFLEFVRYYGISKVTIGGGDPLTRYDIVKLVREIKELDYKVYLDTVGTAILGEAKTVFFGQHTVPGISIREFSGLIDLLGLPIDGASKEVAVHFRKGRRNLLNETIRLLELCAGEAIPVVINTVVTRENFNKLASIANLIAKQESVVEWQLFQYMPIGDLGFHSRERYSIDEDQFVLAARSAGEFCPERIKVNIKSCSSRKNSYLLVTAGGEVWHPLQTPTPIWDIYADVNPQRVILGNISNSSTWPAVIRALNL